MKRASSNDVQQLVTMMDEFYAEGGYPLNHQRATEAFATLLADERLGYVWFIEADGQNVGYVVLTLCYGMEFGGPNAFVDDLFLRLPFRRAGLGTAALTEVRAFCTKFGVRAIHVETGRDNAAAQAVCRRVFTFVGHSSCIGLASLSARSWRSVCVKPSPLNRV